jgi:hypothetical protein
MSAQPTPKKTNPSFSLPPRAGHVQTLAGELRAPFSSWSLRDNIPPPPPPPHTHKHTYAYRPPGGHSFCALALRTWPHAQAPVYLRSVTCQPCKHNPTYPILGFRVSGFGFRCSVETWGSRGRTRLAVSHVSQCRVSVEQIQSNIPQSMATAWTVRYGVSSS